MQDTAHISGLISAMQHGDVAARDLLFKTVYTELRRLARRNLDFWRGNHPTMDTAALVHETFIRLVGKTALNLQSQQHFFHVAAQAMRQIILNYARDKRTQKRDAQLVDIWALDERLDALVADDPERIEALNAALNELEQLDPRAFQVVNYRFFLGMDVLETARMLDVTPRTVNRDWAFARAWLGKTIKQIRITENLAG